MRNKDGVSKIAGKVLVKLLGFYDEIQTAGERMTGCRGWGRSVLNDLEQVQIALNKVGYSPYEYLGYVMFFHPNGICENRIRHPKVVVSQDTFTGFLVFKTSRKSRIHFVKESVLAQYKSTCNVNINGPEDIIENVLTANEVIKLEIIFRNRESFSDEFVRDYIKLVGYTVGEKLRITPEFLSVCPSLTAELKFNGGDNELVRATLTA
jgi:hypothetical protein